jgi:DNA invertase Pin-like site-specific DNA recombinase
LKNIIYLRCSTADQNPDLQLADIQNNFDLQEYEVFRENESAWRENVRRKCFEEISKLVRSGKVKNIYVWDLDRLSRNLKKLKEFFMLCKNYDCKIHSVNQKWLDEINMIMPPFNLIVFELMISILGWISEIESEKKALRVKMAVVKKDNGTFSYKGNRWGRRAFPKQTIDRVLELHLQGKSIREITRFVSVYDRHNNGRPISKSAVHKILVQNTREKDSILPCP